MRLISAFLLVLSFPGLALAQSLQDLINATPERGLLQLPPGIYKGSVEIRRSIIIDGQNQAVVDGLAQGSTIRILSDGVTLQNLRVTNSGFSYNDVDSAIQVRGKFNVIKDNVIDNALFGIDMEQSDNNIIRRNKIYSKEELDLGMRGDAIRLWYSHKNRIENNIIKGSRDLVLWYSDENKLTGNTITDCRYSIHSMFAHRNIVEGNTFTGNAVGVYGMFSRGLLVKKNHISNSTGATGTCVGVKEASEIDIIDNDIFYCATGISLDASPWEPDTENKIIGNRILYNDIGVSFVSDWPGNVVKDNIFKGNITQVAVYGGGVAVRNQWESNFWDDYEGYDRNNDGKGDKPYRAYNYAGRVWMDVPQTRLFKGTPLLEVLDFLDKLAPFTEPPLLLEDKFPQMRSVN